MSQQARELSYAIRFLTIGRYSGQLCLALALLASVPLAVSLLFRDTTSSIRYAAAVLLLGAAGFILSRLQASPRIQTNEAMVIVTLAVLVHPGLTAKTLAATEEHEEELAGGTRAHARRVLLSYGGLTVIGIGILWLLDGDFFHAVFHTFAVVSTGGFSPHGLSLQG